jgi:anti-anti-sigma regulatory factor
MQQDRFDLRLWKPGGRLLVIKPRGSLGSLELRALGKLDAICERLAAAAPRVVIVDLARVPSYGAGLLGALLSLRLKLRSSGGQVVLANDHLRLLAETGLDRLVPTFVRFDTALLHARSIAC